MIQAPHSTVKILQRKLLGVVAGVAADSGKDRRRLAWHCKVLHEQTAYAREGYRRKEVLQIDIEYCAIGLLPSPPPARRSWPSHSQSSPSSTPAFSSSRPGAERIPPTRRGPFGGLVSGHRPRLRARFLRWARRRCSLRVIGAVACGASLWLPIAAYHEALHAGSTEPAALTLRYPLLIRDAVDEPL